MHLIDYGHIRDGVLYHGTISDVAGSPKSTWTYEDAGQKVTRDQLIDNATFNALWNGIADSELFRRCMVHSPDQQIDPVGHHVIGIAFDQEGQQHRYMFMVPVAESDPEFVRWLQLLNVPQGSAS